MTDTEIRANKVVEQIERLSKNGGKSKNSALIKQLRRRLRRYMVALMVECAGYETMIQLTAVEPYENEAKQALTDKLGWVRHRLAVSSLQETALLCIHCNRLLPNRQEGAECHKCSSGKHRCSYEECREVARELIAEYEAKLDAIAEAERDAEYKKEHTPCSDWLRGKD